MIARTQLKEPRHEISNNFTFSQHCWKPHALAQLILVKRPSLPQHKDCNAGKNNKYCATKQGPYTKPPQTLGATINNESTTTEPPPYE